MDQMIVVGSIFVLFSSVVYIRKTIAKAKTILFLNDTRTFRLGFFFEEDKLG